MTSEDAAEYGDADDGGIPHPGGEPVKLRLTALQQDVLYNFIQEFQQNEEPELQPVLDDILDQLPDHAIISRPPSMETLIEIGYFDRGIQSRSFDGPTIIDGGDNGSK